MSADLEADIRRVLGDRCTSASASGVAHSVNLAAASLATAIEKAEADAVNPLLDAKEAVKAKGDLDDLTFRAKRLAAARTALAARVDELRRAEEQAKRDAEREAALAERDEVAARIADEVPGLLRRFAEIVRDIEASDARLNAAGLPTESAEAKARGYAGNGLWANGAGMARRLRDAKLPRFDGPGDAWIFDGINGRAHWVALQG